MLALRLLRAIVACLVLALVAAPVVAIPHREAAAWTAELDARREEAPRHETPRPRSRTAKPRAAAPARPAAARFRPVQRRVWLRNASLLS